MQNMGAQLVLNKLRKLCEKGFCLVHDNIIQSSMQLSFVRLWPAIAFPGVFAIYISALKTAFQLNLKF